MANREAQSSLYNKDEEIVHVIAKTIIYQYDGDQISIRGVFTQEANEEALKQMHSKARILSIYTDNVRISTNESIQTLYAMTKFE